MNETLNTVPQNVIDLSNSISRMTDGCRFVSLTYTSKGTGETSRYTVLVGISYINLVQKSIDELNELLPTLHGDDLIAGQTVMASLQKSLEAHRNGQQNEDYTKKGMYASVKNGVNINLNDNSLQLFGMVISKTVLVPGVHKTVNSKPMTILKNKISKNLSMNNFREFALDSNVILGGKINGETFECSSDFQQLKDVVVPLISTTEKVVA